MARILVIEDNGPNLELMSYLLGAYGHEVVPARDGEEGLEQARRVRAELIVCDIHLPRMDGYQVAKHLKNDPGTRGVPLIAVTALAMVGDREKVLEAGFDGYLAKPIVPETFVAQLEAFLDDGARHGPPVPAAAAALSVSRPAPDAPCTILVVDDVAVNLEVIRQTLEPFGYTVITTATVSDALAQARRLPPDLILSDLHLRGEHGFDLLKAAKSDPRLMATPIVFISASVLGGKDAAAALALGALRFIMRPITPEALLVEIRACLAVQRDRATP